MMIDESMHYKPHLATYIWRSQGLSVLKVKCASFATETLTFEDSRTSIGLAMTYNPLETA